MGIRRQYGMGMGRRVVLELRLRSSRVPACQGTESHQIVSIYLYREDLGFSVARFLDWVLRKGLSITSSLINSSIVELTR